MLGPSDVRKNLNRLMPTAERGQRALRSLSDYRLPVGISREAARACVDAIVFEPPGSTSRRDRSVDGRTERGQIAPGRLDLLRTFTRYFEEQEWLGRHFDFTDCAIGNLLFGRMLSGSGKRL